MVAAGTARRAVFLDRDGVLIANHIRERRPYAISDGDTAVILDGVVEACILLKTAGWLLVMVTNQPDVPRGRTSRAFVDRVNGELAQLLKLDRVQVCFHDNADDCACRKPRPGLLTDAAQALGADLRHSVMVGDRWRDVEAGKAAGCATVLIEYDYDERKGDCADFTAPSLAAAVSWILDRP